jgi:hypothetical protein
MFGRYTKTVAAFVGAAIAFGTLVVTSPQAAISSSEWLSGGIGLATALGVYVLPNTPASNNG